MRELEATAGFRFQGLINVASQGAQYPFIKEYSLDYIRDPSMMQAIFPKP